MRVPNKLSQPTSAADLNRSLNNEVKMKPKLKPKYTVYDDGIIAVGLFVKDADSEKKLLFTLGMRWLPPAPYRDKDNKMHKTTNIMGGETGWFLLPYSFGVAVGRKLIEQKIAGKGLSHYFDEKAFNKMVAWLVEMEELHDAMCY